MNSNGLVFSLIVCIRYVAVVLFARQNSTVRTSLQVVALFGRTEFWIWEGCAVLPLSTLCLALVYCWPPPPPPPPADAFMPPQTSMPAAVAGSDAMDTSAAASHKCESTEIEPGAGPQSAVAHQPAITNTLNGDLSADMVVAAIDVSSGSAAPAQADAVPVPPAPPRVRQWLGVSEAIGSALVGTRVEVVLPRLHAPNFVLW